MHTNIFQNIKKIVLTFKNMDKVCKNILVYGVHASLILFLIGLICLVYDKFILDTITQLRSNSIAIIKTGNIILAESVIGSIIMDYFFKSKNF